MAAIPTHRLPPPGIKSLFAYPVLRAEAIDGDSIRVDFDRGWRDHRIGGILRLHQCDTPELKDARGDLFQQAGAHCQKLVADWLDQASKLNVLMLFSLGSDKYDNRVQGDIGVWTNAGWVYLRDSMVTARAAKEWKTGLTKDRPTWSPLELGQVMLLRRV